MKYLLALSLFLTLQVPGYPPQAAYPYTNGVVIKVDGGVIIDEWTFYDTTPGAISTTKRYPTSITLGKSIKDPVNICVEFQNNTICKNISELRAVLAGQKDVSGVKVK